MSGSEKTHSGLTRRGFLKATAVASAAAAASAGLSSCAKAFSAPSDNLDEEIKFGYCPSGCMNGCRYQFTVREGKIVKAEMAPWNEDSRYNRACPRGLSIPQRVYSPERIKYPMRRVAGTERGAGEWERISWDEAIGQIVDTWKPLIEEFGPAAVACEFGSGNCDRSWFYGNTLANLVGFSGVDNQADQAAIFATRTMLGGTGTPWMASNEQTDLPNTKYLFIMSCNAALSSHQNTNFIYEMKRNGGKVVVIDPTYTPTVSRFADVHVPVRIGTDACLWLGMMNVILAEGLLDTDFLATKTIAPYLVREDTGTFLRLSDVELIDDVETDRNSLILVANGEGEYRLAGEELNPVLSGSYVFGGIQCKTAFDCLEQRIGEYPLDLCAELTGISEDTIEDLAHMFAEGPSMVFSNFGADRYYNGHLAYEGAITALALTGNIGRSGTGFTAGYGCGAEDIAGMVDWMQEMGTSGTFSATGSSAALKVGILQLKDYLEGKLTEDTPCIKSLWVIAANPVAIGANSKNVIDAFNMLDLVVVQDVVWSDSARYADIVLPAKFYTEFETMKGCTAWGVPFVGLMEQCIEPLYEGKIDFDIFNEVFNGLGYSHFTCPSYEEWMKFSFTSARAKETGWTWEKFKEAKVCDLTYRESGSDAAIREQFLTPYNRIVFYQEEPASNNGLPTEFDIEKERMVYWEPPLEAWPETIAGYEASEASRKYPLVMYAARSRWTTHTTHSFVPVLNEFESEPYVRMSPQDAHDRGIQENDMVRVRNDRGYCVLRAHIDAGLQKGYMNVSQRWQEQQFVEGNINELSCVQWNPRVLNSCYNDTMVEVELA